MTAPVDAPAISPSDEDTRGGFARVYRATGYSRVNGPLVAATTRGRMSLPIERVVAADVKVRLGGSSRSIDTREAAVSVSERAIRAALATFGETGAAVSVTLRMQQERYNGVDVEAAAVHAMSAGLALALEQPLTPQKRAALERTVLPGRDSTGLAHPGVGVTAADGTRIRDLEEVPRLRMLLALPANATSADGDHGQLLAPPAHLSAEKVLAAWLTECSSGATSALRAVFDQAHASGEFASLGVVGGFTATDPCALLFTADASSLTGMTKAATQLRALVPAGVSLGSTQLAHPGA